MEEIMSDQGFQADVVHRSGFQFDVTFEDETWAPILVDEPEPLGDGGGPSAARLLAAAVGNCLAASLLLCSQKARVGLVGLTARVEGAMERNESGRLRIAHMDVTLTPVLANQIGPRFDRCLGIFEDFCIVTQSVRDGIEVDVRVQPRIDEPTAVSSPEDEALLGA
jgi:uncharacterized OsmC-like protein